MKLEELRKLRKGTKLMLSMGNGWYQEVRYKGLVQVTSFGCITFQDLMKGEFDFNKGGRNHLDASIEYKDAYGKIQQSHVNPRRLSL